MAFPIAHPAAILPLRKLCPRYFSLSALVIGSVVPDVAYAFGSRTWHYMPWDWWSHHFNGIFYFSLPVGLVMYLLLYILRLPLVHLLPEYQRQLFLPLCHRPFPNPLIILLSLFLGAWTHLAWDSFTHPYGWFTLKWKWLQTPVFDVGQRHVLICQILWYVTSFAGIVWLMIALKRWQLKVEPATKPTAGWGNAFFVALLFFPIEVAHHLIGGARGLAITAMGTLAVFLWVICSMGKSSKTNPAKVS